MKSQAWVKQKVANRDTSTGDWIANLLRRTRNVSTAVVARISIVPEREHWWTGGSLVNGDASANLQFLPWYLSYKNHLNKAHIQYCGNIEPY